MDTLIELYDERAIENVLAADMFRPQRIVYLCPTEVAQNKESQKQIGDFLRHRGWNPELIFLEASLYIKPSFTIVVAIFVLLFCIAISAAEA